MLKTAETPISVPSGYAVLERERPDLTLKINKVSTYACSCLAEAEFRLRVGILLKLRARPRHLPTMRAVRLRSCPGQLPLRRRSGQTGLTQGGTIRFHLWPLSGSLLGGSGRVCIRSRFLLAALPGVPTSDWTAPPPRSLSSLEGASRGGGARSPGFLSERAGPLSGAEARERGCAAGCGGRERGGRADGEGGGPAAGGSGPAGAPGEPLSPQSPAGGHRAGSRRAEPSSTVLSAAAATQRARRRWWRRCGVARPSPAAPRPRRQCGGRDPAPGKRRSREKFAASPRAGPEPGRGRGSRLRDGARELGRLRGRRREERAFNTFFWSGRGEQIRVRSGERRWRATVAGTVVVGTLRGRRLPLGPAGAGWRG